MKPWRALTLTIETWRLKMEACRLKMEACRLKMEPWMSVGRQLVADLHT
jgi:hypothetical protein